MTREFLTGINLNKNELLNAKVHSAASAPSSPVAGQLWYDTTVNKLKFYNGSNWIETAGTSSSPIVAQTSAPSSTDVLWLDTDEPATPSGIVNQATAPSSPTAGMIWYDSTNNLLKYYNGTDWITPVSLDGGGSVVKLGMGYEAGATNNQWYLPGSFTGWSNSGALTQSRTYFSQIFIPYRRNFDQIAVTHGSNAAGTNTYRLGIYASGTDGRPSNVILDAGTVNCTGTFDRGSITINQTLDQGWYWLAMNCQTIGSGGTPSVMQSTVQRFLTQGNTGFNNFNAGVFEQNSVTGAFAEVTTSTSLTRGFPSAKLVGLRAS